MNEQISGEFAEKLAQAAPNCSNEYIINIWRLEGYIKKSREEEIRELLSEEHLLLDKEQNRLRSELIEILDKKLEDKHAE